MLKGSSTYSVESFSVNHAKLAEISKTTILALNITFVWLKNLVSFLNSPASSFGFLSGKVMLSVRDTSTKKNCP